MVARAGLPLQVCFLPFLVEISLPYNLSASSLVKIIFLQDLEFVQFHPTGIYGAGCLITEGFLLFMHI